jgi:hypothetical protein
MGRTDEHDETDMAKLFESNNRERRNDDVMKILLEVLPSTSTDLMVGRPSRGAKWPHDTVLPGQQREIRESFVHTGETPTTLFRSVL